MQNPRLRAETARLFGATSIASRYPLPAATLIGTLLLACSSVFAREDQSRRGEAKIEEVFQDLFLGKIIYPQEQGVLQCTTGFLRSHDGEDDFALPAVFEYGITDYFQIGIGIPTEFVRTGPHDASGVGNIELEVYYNFFNDADSGRACGAGFAVGFPTATPDVREREMIYEPFLVVYRELDAFHLNLSAAVEIKDPIFAGEQTEVVGELEAAVFRRLGRFVALMELGVEIETEQTQLRLAPGLYWQPRANLEFGVALPVGLTRQTPDLGVFVLITVEFGGETGGGFGRNGEEDRLTRRLENKHVH